MIHQPICSAARGALLHPLVLLIVGLVSWPLEWEGIRELIDSARAASPRLADRQVHALGYYEEIIGGSNGGRLQWAACRQLRNSAPGIPSRDP